MSEVRYYFIAVDGDGNDVPFTLSQYWFECVYYLADSFEHPVCSVQECEQFLKEEGYSVSRVRLSPREEPTDGDKHYGMGFEKGDGDE